MRGGEKQNGSCAGCGYALRYHFHAAAAAADGKEGGAEKKSAPY